MWHGHDAHIRHDLREASSMTSVATVRRALPAGEIESPPRADVRAAALVLVVVGLYAASGALPSSASPVIIGALVVATLIGVALRNPYAVHAGLLTAIYLGVYRLPRVGSLWPLPLFLIYRSLRHDRPSIDVATRILRMAPPRTTRPHEHISDRDLRQRFGDSPDHVAILDEYGSHTLSLFRPECSALDDPFRHRRVRRIERGVRGDHLAGGPDARSRSRRRPRQIGSGFSRALDSVSGITPASRAVGLV